VVDGIKQKPIEGVSLAYTFDQKNAQAPSKHKTQYFEMFGDHAIYHEGWIASTKVVRPPWVLASAGNPDPLNHCTWELYDLTKDWTQSEDLAAKYPDKVKEMSTLFLQEARKYQVLPLDASVATRVVQPRPNITAGRSEFVYTHLMKGLPLGESPSLLNCSYTVTADLDVPQTGAEGMIVTCGGRFAGYGFYLLKGKPVWTWNLFDLKRERWEGPGALAPGKHTLEFDFKYDGLGVGTLAFNNLSGIGRGGTGTLKVDGKEVATRKMENTIPIILQFDESFDIGSDTLTGVDDQDYQVPFPLTAKLNKLTIKIDRPQLSPEDIKKLEENGQRNNKASE
jgi:arylsulfatase